MRKIETIEEFYTQKFGGMPEDIRKEIGHFNVFKLDPFVGNNAKPVPYGRRDFFKIMLVQVTTGCTMPMGLPKYKSRH